MCDHARNLVSIQSGDVGCLKSLSFVAKTGNQDVRAEEQRAVRVLSKKAVKTLLIAGFQDPYHLGDST